MEMLRRAAGVLIGLATGLAIVAVVLPLFLTPWWVAFEQGRADAAAWTGFSEPELRDATEAILGDLVIGPPDFDVAVGGEPVLDERERGHMRDVRGVFTGFFAAALIATAGALVIVARRRGTQRARTWRAIRAGALMLIGALIIGAVVSVVAFDALFETFHRLLFPGGSYTFDPATERLVQLFPFQFWQESALAVGVVCIVVAGVVAAVAHARATSIVAAASRESRLAGPEPTTPASAAPAQPITGPSR